MTIQIQFYSYFRDLAGCAEIVEEFEPGATVKDLLARVHQRFPKLQPAERSTLVAVGVEYQDRGYQLKPHDSVSLFPPVQGG